MVPPKLSATTPTSSRSWEARSASSGVWSVTADAWVPRSTLQPAGSV